MNKKIIYKRSYNYNNIIIQTHYKYTNDFIDYKNNIKNNCIEKIQYYIRLKFIKKFVKVYIDNFVNRIDNRNKKFTFLFEVIDNYIINVYKINSNKLIKFFHINFDLDIINDKINDIISEYYENKSYDIYEKFIYTLMEENHIKIEVSPVVIKYNYNYFNKIKSFNKLKFIDIVLDIFSQFNKDILRLKHNNVFIKKQINYDYYIGVYNNIQEQWLGSKWIEKIINHKHIFTNYKNRKNLINLIYYELLDKYIQYLISKNIFAENILDDIQYLKDKCNSVVIQSDNLYNSIYDCFVYLLLNDFDVDISIYNNIKKLYEFKKYYTDVDINLDDFINIYNTNFLQIINDADFYNFIIENQISIILDKLNKSYLKNNKKDIKYYFNTRDKLIDIKNKVKYSNEMLFKDIIYVLKYMITLIICENT